MALLTRDWKLVLERDAQLNLEMEVDVAGTNDRVDG